MVPLLGAPTIIYAYIYIFIYIFENCSWILCHIWIYQFLPYTDNEFIPYDIIFQ